MSIKNITTEDLRRMNGQEALILQGCGGDLQEWLDGINELLTEKGILQNGTLFRECLCFHNDADNLTCLVFPFSEDVDLNVGKLAVWRLSTYRNVGGTWLSDYVPNKLGGFFHGDPQKPEEENPSFEKDVNIQVYNHYKNSLAIQFGMMISGNEALVVAYESECEELDALFETWVQEFLQSDADDSYEFFESKIYDWVESHKDGHETVAIAQSGLRPGERTYAIVHEKKLNALVRWIPTKNLVVKPILCTEIRFAEGEEPKVIGYAWADDGNPFFEAEAKDCFISETAAMEALKERR